MHCDEDRLLLLIKELLAIQFVVEVSAEQFAFRHALTQQAVYTGLLARERRSLHRTLAEAIEQLYATTLMLDAHLEDLAYHYYEAEIWSKALEYEQRAGEKALALYAPHAAINHFTHALSALHHLSGVQPSGKLHLGNYFGAIKQHIELQEQGDCFYFIANYHAQTTMRDLAERMSALPHEPILKNGCRRRGRAVFALSPCGRGRLGGATSENG